MCDFVAASDRRLCTLMGWTRVGNDRRKWILANVLPLLRSSPSLDIRRSLTNNNLTTLPEDMFLDMAGMTAL